MREGRYAGSLFLLILLGRACGIGCAGAGIVGDAARRRLPLISPSEPSKISIADTYYYGMIEARPVILAQPSSVPLPITGKATTSTTLQGNRL